MHSDMEDDRWSSSIGIFSMTSAGSFMMQNGKTCA
jgi:hypothetical protein